MKKQIKEIDFNKTRSKKSYFDLVGLEEILKKRPKDHSQYEHHKISFYVIIIITEKKGKHTINYTDYSYKKGTVFTLRKKSIHKFHESDAEGKFLVFTDDFVVRFGDSKASLKLFQLFNEMLASPKLQLNQTDFALIEELLGQIENEHRKVKDEYSVDIIRSLMQVLIHRLFRIKSHSSESLVASKYQSQFMVLHELIEENCFESKKVSFYAGKMGISSRTLNNVTQGVIGRNAKALIDEIVVLQIKSLLINSQLTFTEIAYQAGFDDPTNFFKYFRKKTGLSPKSFKENSK